MVIPSAHESIANSFTAISFCTVDIALHCLYIAFKLINSFSARFLRARSSSSAASSAAGSALGVSGLSSSLVASSTARRFVPRSPSVTITFVMSSSSTVATAAGARSWPNGHDIARVDVPATARTRLYDAFARDARRARDRRRARRP